MLKVPKNLNPLLGPLPLPIQFARASRQRLVDAITHKLPVDDKLKTHFRVYWYTYKQGDSLLNDVPCQDFCNYIHANSYKSSTIRAANYKEVLFQCAARNWSAVQALTSKPLKTSDDVLQHVVIQALQSRDIIVAIDLFLLFYKLEPQAEIDPSLYYQIIDALCYQNPKYDASHLHKLFQLLDFLAVKRQITPKLSNWQMSCLCNKALSLTTQHSVLTKKIISRILNGTDTSQRTIAVSAIYKLIDMDYRKNNVAGIYYHWCRIKNQYTSIIHHDPRIIYKLLKSFTTNKAYRKNAKEIVDNLPPEHYANNPLLLPSIIEYATKTHDLKLAHTIMQNVNKYLQKENYDIVLKNKQCLLSFLQMHLQFNDSKGVERVLNDLQTIYGDIDQGAYKSIVSHLAQTGRIDNLLKAVDMVIDLPFDRAIASYTVVINALLQQEAVSKVNLISKRGKKYSFIINGLLERVHSHDPRHLLSFWNVIASLYIKHLVQYKQTQHKASDKDPIALDIAKLTYLRSDQRHPANDWSNIDYNPFSVASPHKVCLKITDSNRFVILRNIAMSAIQHRRKDIFLWSCSILYKRGMPVKELILDWNMMLKHQIRRSNFQNNNEMDQTLSLEGVKFIEEVLK